MTARLYPMPSLRTVAMRTIHTQCCDYWMRAAGIAIGCALSASACAYFDLTLAAHILVCLSAAFSGASACAAVIGARYAP